MSSFNLIFHFTLCPPGTLASKIEIRDDVAIDIVMNYLFKLISNVDPDSIDNYIWDTRFFKICFFMHHLSTYCLHENDFDRSKWKIKQRKNSDKEALYRFIERKNKTRAWSGGLMAKSAKIQTQEPQHSQSSITCQGVFRFFIVQKIIHKNTQKP